MTLDVAPAKGGFKLAGWSTSADGNVEYRIRDIVAPAGNMTLYAVWNETPVEPKPPTGGEDSDVGNGYGIGDGNEGGPTGCDSTGGGTTERGFTSSSSTGGGSDGNDDDDPSTPTEAYPEMGPETGHPATVKTVPETPILDARH